MKLKNLCRILLAAFGSLLLTMVSLWQIQQVSHAQGEITLTKVLNRSSNVVRVGELLNFTIALTNNSAFTLTHVTLVDNYDNTTMAFAQATPAQTTVDPGAGVIIWDNVAAPPIPPGQNIVLTVVFTAEHPRTTVVNAVRAQDIINSSGQISQTAEASQTNESIGGNAPVVKFLAPGATPQAGLPVTFTHIITNDGAAIMTRLPLTDTYDPTFLDFVFAVPPPTISSTPGVLVWDDLTDYFGDVQPFATVVVTTVFSATTQVLNTVNQASTEGALDVYNNDLTAGVAQVPITIIFDTPTPTPTTDSGNNNNDNNNDNNDNDDNDNAAAPVPTATAVAALIQATATATAESSGPKYLPETGQFPTGQILVLLLGVVLITAGWFLKKVNN